MSFFRTEKAFFVKMLLVLTSVTIMTVSVPAIRANAVSYIGSGTEKDPFLVTTAEQLDGMRNNLSAHYKLAATIDMSSFGDLEPIGFLAQPFTGSFTCDIAEDGLPYYAIKNLTVNNKRGLINKHEFATGNFPDYVKDNSHWEAALFGATKGAKFKGIFLLNSSITNTCVGELTHTYPGGDKSKPYIPCPGVNENATGTLVAIAKETVIDGCMSSGSINTKTNHSGGIVGLLTDSSIINSYSTVNVTSAGSWAAGGLVGSLVNSTVQYCFATGDINAPMKKSFENVSLDLAAGLIGSMSSSSIVSDCYSTGKISSNGNSFIPLENEKVDMVTNCYTTGVVDGITAVPSEKKNKNNCYVLAAPGCKMTMFSAASAEEINSAFSNLEGWQTGNDTYPTLASIKILGDEAIYIAGGQRAGITPPSTSAIISSGTSTTDGNDDSDSANNGTTVDSTDGNTEVTKEVTKEEESNQADSSISGEKQILIIVLTTIIVAVSVLTSVVLISILKNINTKENEENV